MKLRGAGAIKRHSDWRPFLPPHGAERPPFGVRRAVAGRSRLAPDFLRGPPGGFEMLLSESLPAGEARGRGKIGPSKTRKNAAWLC